uniref:Uncharacterized protein n=1 Tax=Anguilla anguilla TaxID=7936 RepID=A0A0E9Q4K6_ANGAN
MLFYVGFSFKVDIEGNLTVYSKHCTVSFSARAM